MSLAETRSYGRSGPIAGPGVGRHLLIVDDDDRIRELLKEFLAREGYRVTGAAHAAAARSQAARAGPSPASQSCQSAVAGSPATRWTSSR
jgi:hypothetical protein